ncbi:MAG TPA: hypothetical protein VF625_08855 [Longimicrobium sp.]
MEESHRLPAAAGTEASRADGLHRDDVRAAAEEAGISPEFVEIALAEASASAGPSSIMSRSDILGARLFLGATRYAIEASATVTGDVDSVSAAVLHVFAGHPCLLQADEVAELPSWSGRVIVFNVPKYDWGATANPPFVEKAAAIGLKQLHVAVRPLPGEPATCEVVVAGDLQPGMRKTWRWSAATSVGATAAGGAAGVGFAATMVTGAILIAPAVLGAVVFSGASVGLWALTYRYYRGAVEASLKESLRLLQTAVRAGASNLGARQLAPGNRASP